jgi:hypothetical protein
MAKHRLRRRWSVFTSDGASERSGEDDVHLGDFYGTVDEIALRLANRQRGFWCDGHLLFRPAGPPNPIKLGKLHDRVNIRVEGMDLKHDSKRAKTFFKGRPVRVEECNLYGAITLVRIKLPRPRRG